MSEEDLRKIFEALVGGRDSYGLRRSRRGTYVNPAIARDWKWFRLGAKAELPTALACTNHDTREPSPAP